MSFLAKLGAVAASVISPGIATAAMREDAFGSNTTASTTVSKPSLVGYAFCEYDNKEDKLEACILESDRADEFFDDLKFFVKVTQQELTDKIMVCCKYSDDVCEFIRLDHCIQRGFVV